MGFIAYVNGAYVPHAEAQVAIEDRGYQFADGVYEVAPICNGAIVDLKEHLDRLDNSLAGLRIAWPMPRRALELVMAELNRRNRVGEGIIYLQISRGVAPRDHGFPKSTVRPSLVITTKAVPWPRQADDDTGVSIITTPDNRWGRCDIKAIALLPNVMGKQRAREANAFEAWFVRPDGTIAEGASTNAWLVDGEGRLVTRPLGPEILPGVTRATVIRLARAAGIPVVERPFSVQELMAAREVFLTSTTALARAVTEIDGRPVGNRFPGIVTRRLRGMVLAHYRQGNPGAD